MDSIQSFLSMWTPMTAAMMAPSAMPFIVSLARRSRPWPPAAALAVAAYLLVWTAFGAAVYYVSGTVSLPVPAAMAAGAAIVLAGLYSLTPWMRAGQARCIAMCTEQKQLGLRGAFFEGVAYGSSCILCSAGVMLAVVALGMTNVAWVALGAAIVLVYKFASVRSLVTGQAGG